MKNQTILKFILTLIVGVCINKNLHAQFTMAGPLFGDRYGITSSGPGNANNVRAIGIGNFTASPLSALHVNSNLLAPSTVIVQGEVFRTSSNAMGTDLNAWRMFTGTGNGVEKFALYSPANSNNVFLQTTQTGKLIFNTNGNQERLIIDENGNVFVNNFLVLKSTESNKKFIIIINDNGEISTLPFTEI